MLLHKYVNQKFVDGHGITELPQWYQMMFVIVQRYIFSRCSNMFNERLLSHMADSRLNNTVGLRNSETLMSS